MITRIEIDGYKSFSDLSIDLQPFTVIAGVNGVGKSNLFDAMRHLSRLVSLTFRESFETERGSLVDLFTIYPDGSRAEAIKYAVEMLLPRQITDSFSELADLKYIRMRYEISVGFSAEENRLTLVNEKLTAIKRGEDDFISRNKSKIAELPRLTGGRTPFIDTEGSIVSISQDGRSGNKRTYNALQAQRSVISTVLTVEFPHVYACKTLIENILFLQLNPESLRQPSKFMTSPYIRSDGGNLSSVLQRIKNLYPDQMHKISQELSSIVPNAKSVEVEVDEKREEYVLSVTHRDGYKVHSKLLSDGTLRILALLSVRYDPEFQGVLIFEEPENGIHPGRIPRVVNLLRSMAEFGGGGGTKQVIVNTHSTKVLESTEFSEVAMAYSVKRRIKDKGVFTKTGISFVESPLLSIGDKVAYQELYKILDNPKSSEEGL